MINMTHNISKLIGAVAVSILLTSIANANSAVRHIIHPDGRIEFTNIGNTPRLLARIPSSRTPSPLVKEFYSYRSPNGTLTFSDKRPGSEVQYQIIRFDCASCLNDSTITWKPTQLFTDHFSADIERESRRFNVDPALVRAIIHAESSFNPRAVSPKGAQGLMQLMPPTATDLGVQSAMDVSQNIYGGVKYLSWMLKRFNGDISLATAAYNAGPGAVQRYGGIPPFAETQAYIERVAFLHQLYSQLN